MQILFTLLAFFISLFWLCVVGYPYEITLKWDENDEPEVVGYRLYYGKETGQYLEHQNVSLEACNTGTCTTTVSVADGHWYFAVTAYDYVQESDFSNEVFENVSAGLIQPVLDIKVNGKDGPFTVVQENVEWTLSIDPGDFEGTTCEWWLGLYWNQRTFWWIEGRQLPLLDLTQTVLLDGTLPEGFWTFFIYLYENPKEGSDAVVWQDYVYVWIQ